MTNCVAGRAAIWKKRAGHTQQNYRFSSYIAVTHEIGESGDANYIVSKFVEGVTLCEVLRLKNPPLAEIFDISIQTANALTAAHAARIVHRDIKRENVVIRTEGLVKILDFGLRTETLPVFILNLADSRKLLI